MLSINEATKSRWLSNVLRNVKRKSYFNKPKKFATPNLKKIRRTNPIDRKLRNI